jgi:uncharacterized membrane-anchored protein YjiN (DUF445 family)
LSIETKLAKTLAIEDPARRLEAAHQLMAEIDAVKKQASECRAVAAYEAWAEFRDTRQLPKEERRGASQPVQAELIGVSKGLIQQLVLDGEQIATVRAHLAAAEAIAAQRAPADSGTLR